MRKKIKKLNSRLKNLFVAHEGNNYHPGMLKRRTLLLHSIGAVLIKALLLIGILIIPVSAYLTPDVMSEQSKKIITLTNEVRTNLKIKPLAENELLDKAALNKSQDMLVGQYFAHISPDNKAVNYFLQQVKYDYEMAGENLAIGFSGADDVVNAWIKSKTHYANMIDPDFTEIGVGMVSGKYKDFDTTFVSEYFGARAEEIVPVKAAAKTAISNKTAATSLKNSNKTSQVLGEKITAALPLEVDQTKTQVWVDEPQGKDQKIIRVVAYLSSNTVKADAHLGNFTISLMQDQAEPSKWTGSLLIFNQDEEQIFNPVVLPTITMTDELGNTKTFDVNWQNIKPVKSSLLSQYFFAKNNSNNFLKWLFDISGAYYKILLVLVVFSLILNIIIQIRKQHYKIIIPSLGFIALFILLILF